jgi:hypothetical protein
VVELTFDGVLWLVLVGGELWGFSPYGEDARAMAVVARGIAEPSARTFARESRLFGAKYLTRRR